MQTIDIGLQIDLVKLLETRMLINAGSGGGKSYLIRRLSESASGQVQQIIFDYEGEFVTLREKYPFALVAVNDGDIPLNIRYAGKLAETIMKTNLSVIIDLYDLEPDDRVLFVQEFLHALMKLPRELYHPVLVYVDEIDVFCPQTGATAASKDVRNLAARGRKKGLCIIAATQRLSKVHKDVAAECQNKMIGQTTLGIDITRGGEELGLPAKDHSLLRDLDPGNFFAYGPAISRKVIPFKVSPVTTTHVKAGTLIVAPPVPGAIKEILGQLKDLPAEAEQDLETKEQLQEEVRRLLKEIERVKKSTGSIQDEVAIDLLRRAEDRVASQGSAIIQLQDRLKQANDIILAAGVLLQPVEAPLFHFDLEVTKNNISVKKAAKAEFTRTSDHIPEPMVLGNPTPQSTPFAAEYNPGKCSRAILSFLAGHRSRDFTRIQIGVVTGYSINSSGFQNSLSELGTRQLIIRGERIKINTVKAKEIEELIGKVKPQSFNQDTFKKHLSKCELEIYNILIHEPHSTFSKEVIASRTPSKYSVTSSGFQNALSRLSSLEILVREKGAVKLNPDILALMK